MNGIADDKSRVELMPGLFRQNVNSSVLITFLWHSGMGGFYQKVIETLVFIFGLIFMIMSTGGVSLYFTGHSNIFQTLIYLPFLMIGFFLVYRGLAYMVNRSVFIISNQGLTVRHYPLPFMGAANVDMNYAEISTVEWRKVGDSTHSRDMNGSLLTGYSAVFDVILTNNQGKTYKLLSTIQAREYAFAIASEVTRLIHK